MITLFHVVVRERHCCFLKKKGRVWGEGGADYWLDVRKKGGGVIQMRTDCNRGGGGGLKIRKKCVCN